MSSGHEKLGGQRKRTVTKGVRIVKRVMKAPAIKEFIDFLGQVEYRNINNCFTYDEASYEAIQQLFALLHHRLEPVSGENCWELWLRAERGSIEDFADVEKLMAQGRVETREELEARWRSSFPEEVLWFEFVAVEDEAAAYRAVVLDHRHVLETDGSKGRSVPHDISDFTGWLLEAVRQAVQDVENHVYQERVERELPVRHRTGTILRRDLWKVFPEWRASFFQGISPQEADYFLASAVEDPPGAGKRLASMTANDFYHFCALGYRAMGCDGTEKPEKEQYYLHADGRDKGLSAIEGDSPEAFARWLLTCNDCHPWEVCRRGVGAIMNCIVRRDRHGYYLMVDGLADSRTAKAIRFFLALDRAGVPVCIKNAEELKARLTGEERIGIVPEGVFPVHCQALFPGENMIDFMNLPSRRQEAFAKYCRWQPIAAPRIRRKADE